MKYKPVSRVIELKLTYVPCLIKAFDSPSRIKVISKGRRLGLTQNTAQFLIEKMIENKIKVLWGDTIHANIVNYIERYWMSVLKQLKGLWKWKKQEKKIILNGSVCDFRSADQPENWEGFGYHYIFLNEAGIILKNRYLWDNAVRPMLMDYPDSVCIIGGTPKGKNLFHNLWQKAQEDLTGRWQAFRFSTYQNPFLARSEIEDIIKDLNENTIRQEIFGEFVDQADNYLLPFDLVSAAMEIESGDERGAEKWAIDPARFGDDGTAFGKRRGLHVYKVEKKYGLDTMEIVSWVSNEYMRAKVKPQIIIIDIIGIGAGVFDRLKQLGLPVVPVNFAEKSFYPGAKNIRSECYMKLKEDLKLGLKLPKDEELLEDLTAIKYKYDNRGLLQIEAKEKIKQELGRSTDKGDVVAMLEYLPAIDQETQDIQNNQWGELPKMKAGW